MKVQLERAFPMPAGADTAWRFLQDIEAVAACMPGAKITERLDDRHFKGTVTVRIGPATMSFRGDVELKEIDAATRTIRLVGTGTDTTGTSGASMDLTARIDGTSDASSLVGNAEVSMSGKAAAFGGRVMTTVADQVLKQFAGTFAEQVAALAAPGSEGNPPPGGASPSGGSTATAAAAPRELNALRLAWAIIVDWLRARFGKTPA